MMKVLIGHNAYQVPGGEDSVVQSEAAILHGAGVEVVLYERHNSELKHASSIGKLQHLWNLKWSKQSYRELKEIIRKHRPDVAHFHNIFFMISPSVYDACQDEGVPVVQSLHNFRLLCANALFYRQNQVCEQCLEQNDLSLGVRYGCYRNSRLLSYLLVRMLKHHWKVRTWEQKIDMFITASEFTKSKYVQRGISADNIYVKPNFVAADHQQDHSLEPYALFIGRLSHEKGVDRLLTAWKSIKNFSLKIVGKGPLLEEFQNTIKTHQIDNVEIMGYQSDEELKTLLQKSRFMIIPSQCYESYPRVLVEAFAYGKAILASRLGSLAEIIDDYHTGVLFDAKDQHDFTKKIQWMIKNQSKVQEMGKNARQTYETKYSPEQNKRQLLEVYELARQRSQK